ncbi:transcriptional regulator [Candidatus Woesearchaeota archaeon]|nr:transcriptional regulator [Candidatus Woesearchaeota archaeon]
MELPQEIELWYVIPAIRKALVTELKKHKMKQKDIAPLLGITEAAVSQYMRDKRASRCYEAFQKDPLKAEIKAAANRIMENNSPDSDVARREITRLCKAIKESKVICDIHRRQNPKISKCDICFEK